MSDPVIVSLDNLVVHHQTQVDAWILSLSDLATDDIRRVMIAGLIDFHAGAVELLKNTIKELKQYAGHGTGSSGSDDANSNLLGRGQNAIN